MKTVRAGLRAFARASLVLVAGCGSDEGSDFPKTDEIVSFSASTAQGPILTRWRTLAEVPEEYRDTRLSPLMLGNRQELFGLAMSDMFLCWQLSNQLPLVATGYRLSPHAAVRNYVNRQLSEIASWNRLNRPGWTLYLPGEPVPADYDDGNWLGTGWCIEAIVDTLRLMRPAIERDTLDQLHALLRREIASVRDDFRQHRPWYWDYPISNQFVLPNAGVLLAALELGQKVGDDDYEFAVRNLLRYLDSQGDDGSHHEGPNYAAVSNQIVMYAALSTSEIGDQRLSTHPHLRNFPKWLISLLQPGSNFVNAHDGTSKKVDISEPHAYTSGAPGAGVMYFDSLLMAGMVTGDPSVGWVVDNVFGGPQATATGYRFHRNSKDLGRDTRPPTYAYAAASPLVTWRSSWDERATGVWIRGADPSDSHEHRDSGHVSFTLNGSEVLVDAGNTAYGYPDYDTYFVSSLGHNVLQVGESDDGRQLKGTGSKVTVRRLDSLGGDVEIDSSSEYLKGMLQSWVRDVSWDERGLRVRDSVTLTAGRPDTVLFRFHLADLTPITVSSSGAGCESATVNWKDVVLELSANACLSVDSVLLPIGISFEEHPLHTVIEIRTVEPVGELVLETRVRGSS